MKLQITGGIIRISSLLILFIVLVQCRGQRGDDGIDGIDGDYYAYSAVYDVDPSAWEGNLDGYDAYLDVPEITDDIYYDGAVLVYRLFETEPKSFNLLPYTYVDNALAVYFDFDAYVGIINLMYKEVYDGVNDTPVPSDVMTFKVLIIEGIPLATLKTKVDVTDFNAVTKMFNINTSTIKVQ